MRHAGLILLCSLIACGATLPQQGPVPAEKPENSSKPTPAPKPAAPTDNDSSATGKTESGRDLPAGWKDDAIDAVPPVIVEIEKEDEGAYRACLAALRTLGASFTEGARIDDGKGCGIDKPIEVNEILPGTSLKPEGTMRCETALALARWTRETAAPAAKVAFGPDAAIGSLNQASSYVCRLRNNGSTGKISEHARGNAIDIASITLKDGKTIDIQPRDDDGTLTGAFQRAITATACLYFTTVLDPGSDAAHETHLHFDVIERKNGYRYCR
ncbi:extensin family protein [Sinorhizobium alkalisoli]|uniref:Extensin n=1 Tax=Sinorhizobium alkalisoli TaxID=1752398 RepID=A0A1E3VDA6_9HYPH|nr:extensin family protein [Sinorhizobium alkalisoli]MCA1490820.1 extensin family protein [Ensifer sp. NBAIM29]MCG5479080.1 extensin family protein [Sinorhizobium alkalisoli]ODR91570.1 extensin [Sinorhizobium alkalisoli]QFI67259.1 extensin-like protein [Sinorhizobium alkalisoli]